MKVLIILVVIGVLLLCSINSSKVLESFEPLKPGNVPCVSEQPILYGDYPVKKDPMVSNLGYGQLWKYYPVNPVGSYKQETNNVRYWATPNNGTCSPAIFCGGLYDNKKLNIPAPPSPPPIDNNDIRVNYYNSERVGNNLFIR